MTLTPADVHAMTFATVRFGQRGYDLEEVDAFLDIVQKDLALLYEQVERGRATGGDRSASFAEEPSPPDAPNDLAERLARTELALMEARADADMLRSRLAPSDETRIIGRHSTMDAQADAAVQSERLQAALAEARREATTAHAYAEQVRDEARKAIAAILADAQRSREEAEQTRADMARDSATLERLLSNWRSAAVEQNGQLAAYIDTQLDIVRNRRSEPAVDANESGSADDEPS